MRFITLRKCHVEAIKAVSRVGVFLLKKCWLQFTSLIILIVLIYGFYGGLIAIASGFFGATGVVYKINDWFLYHPDDPPDSRTNVASPALLRLPFDTTFVKTKDGILINLVIIKQEPPARFASAPTIVYLHGNAGNIGHRLQNAYELYSHLNCNVVLVEYRGYGLSKGSPSEAGLYLDGEAAITYLLQHPVINRDAIVVFGRSLGGAVAIDLAQNPKLSGNIAAIIVENTFTSIPDMARILFDCRLLRMIPEWFYKNKFNSSGKIGQVLVPSLMISGSADELIPPSMMTTLYQLSGSIIKQYHCFAHGTHNFTWKCKDYYVVIQSFIHQIISRSSRESLIVEKKPHLSSPDDGFMAGSLQDHSSRITNLIQSGQDIIKPSDIEIV